MWLGILIVYGSLLLIAMFDIWLIRPLYKLIKAGQKCRKGRKK